MISHLIRNIIFILNLFVSLALFFGWIGSFHYSYHYAFINILALFLPVLYVINLPFLVYWLIFSNHKKNSFISFIPLLLCCFIFNRFYNLSSKEKSIGNISVMTYNIKSFTPYYNLYNEDSAQISKRQNFKLIDSIQPDILCLQEFSERGKEIRKKFKRYILNSSLDHKKYRPTMILTNFPIVHHFSIDFEGDYANNVVADLKIEDDTVRVFNIHMESLSLMSKYMNNIHSEDEAKDAAKNYYQNLNNGFQQHQKQIDKIAEEIRRSPYPVILCGDFNNTPFSYEYNKSLAFLQDTYLVAGSGIIETYHNIPFPTRIDHIFASDNFIINSYQVLDHQKISDHYPIKVTLSLKNNE